MIGISSSDASSAVGAVVLGEDAAVVDALLAGSRRASVGGLLPSLGALGVVTRFGEVRCPRSAATQHITFDATKCCGLPRISQMPWSGSWLIVDRGVDERGDAVPDLRRDLAAVADVRADRVEEHPPHVVLMLVVRTVADAHGTRVVGIRRGGRACAR